MIPLFRLILSFIRYLNYLEDYEKIERDWWGQEHYRRKYNNDYNAYLKSDRWKSKRDRRKKIDGYRCTQCRSKSNLQVHHLTYENKYVEEMDDLITLCGKCHKKEHEL